MSLRKIGIIVQTPQALPPLWIGPPGGGKTARLRLLAQRLGMPMSRIIGANREPTQFAWDTRIGADGALSIGLPPWSDVLFKARRAMLFIDEATNMSTSQWSAAQNLVHERVVGETPLPTETVIVAAGNPSSQGCGGFDPPDSAANRWTWVCNGTPSAAAVHAHLRGMLAGDDGGTDDDVVPLLTDLPDWEQRWNAAYATELALGTVFHARNPGKLAEDEKVYKGRWPLAFATPRTWENVYRLRATCRVLGADDVRLDLTSGSIGEPLALEYETWCATNDLGDPEEYLAHPDRFMPDPKRPDRDFALMLAVATAATSGKATTPKQKEVKQKRWNAAWRVIARGMPSGKDLVVIAASELVIHRPKGGLLDPEIKAIIDELRPVLEGSGLLAGNEEAA